MQRFRRDGLSKAIRCLSRFQENLSAILCKQMFVLYGHYSTYVRFWIEKREQSGVTEESRKGSLRGYPFLILGDRPLGQIMAQPPTPAMGNGAFHGVPH
jgi:hypothetical protein